MPPGFLFSCNLVAARFFKFCRRLSALINDGLTVGLVEPDEEDELLLEEELLPPPDGLLLIALDVDLIVACLLNPVMRVVALLPTKELGESERLLTKKMGLLDLGRLTVPPTLLLLLLLLPGTFPELLLLSGLQSEQKKTERGSFTSASLMVGRWHS